MSDHICCGCGIPQAALDAAREEGRREARAEWDRNIIHATEAARAAERERLRGLLREAAGSHRDFCIDPTCTLNERLMAEGAE